MWILVCDVYPGKSLCAKRQCKYQGKIGFEAGKQEVNRTTWKRNTGAEQRNRKEKAKKDAV